MVLTGLELIPIISGALSAASSIKTLSRDDKVLRGPLKAILELLQLTCIHQQKRDCDCDRAVSRSPAVTLREKSNDTQTDIFEKAWATNGSRAWANETGAWAVSVPGGESAAMRITSKKTSSSEKWA